jgi:hypothetical protein
MLRHFIACVRGEASYQGTPPEQAIESMQAALMLVKSAERQRGTSSRSSP